VWSGTRIEGGRAFAGKLPLPPNIAGSFQSQARREAFGPPLPREPTFYGDSAVIAYRLPDDEMLMADAKPKITANGNAIDAAALVDGDLNKTVDVVIPEGGRPAMLQFEFAAPFRASAVSITAGGRGMPRGEVQASLDGANYVTLATLPGPAHTFLQARTLPYTYSFPAIVARFYRFKLTTPAAGGALDAVFSAAPPKKHDIAEIEFHSTARVHRWEDKAGFAILNEYDSVRTPSPPAAAAIASSNVIDLTAKMDKDGNLNWEAPAGKWMILRMGYSLTGAKNAPAPPEATGLESDKLSRKHMEAYFQNYANPIEDALGPLFGKTLKYILTDSWEAGLQNWTEEMLSEFRTRRGYDATPYLPALTGRIVESADVSDRFLWDFRQTIADLLAENHYRTAVEYFGQRGVKIYGEAAGTNNPMFQDALRNKGLTEIPMGEFWQLLPGQKESNPEHLTDIREAASAAHIYGKKLVAAESFTAMPMIANWGAPPAGLKGVGDHFLALGVNHFVLHCSVHRPLMNKRPGITLGPFGQHFTRNNTWAEQAAGWLSYLARSSYMLQQGLFVSDLAYFIGEGAPAITFQGEKTSPSPQPPAGYAYDYFNPEVLLTRMSVQNGRVVLPDGMSYRVLVVPDHLDRMTLPTLRKLRDLVAAGATLVGPKPKHSPSLSGYPNSETELRAIVNEVWGAADGRTVLENSYVMGKVYWGKPLTEVLAAQGTPPDFEYNKPHFDTTLEYLHRQSGDTQIYFVTNQKARAEEVNVRVRVDGKAAEIWHPETGAISPASYTIENGRTTVPLTLQPNEAVFLVFRQNADATSRVLPKAVSTPLAMVQGAWEVSFPPNLGAPAKVKFDNLSSWSTHTDEGVKYFSGTAAYTKEINAPTSWFRPGAKLMLDLGTVKEIAEVSINGNAVGLLWRAPFQIDVTNALKPGTNKLEIKVTNLWQNRMIGDLSLPEDKRYTFATLRPYKKDSPLLESGLLGPVTVSALTTK
jgi:(4-O-methyl)-D-glucuronate---lignin esterase